MASPSRKIQPWTTVRGWNRSMSPLALPDGLVPACLNIELVPGAIGRRRPSLQAMNTADFEAAFVPVYQYDFVTAAGVHELWTFGVRSAGSVGAAYRRVAGVVTLVSLPDSPGGSTFVSTGGPHCATLNGKLFIAYDSAVNRLHLWDGASVRRVGIGASAAPTVANGGGGGAYAATARRYRVSWRIKSGSTIVTESELSAAVSFTPSGANANATITKPTTPDSATHWVVWGLISTMGDTYDLYEELSEIAIGTTTYADTTAPASYVGDAPPVLGLNIPPPSAKYLLSDGQRLLMGGAWETSAAAGETAPANSRVWFTRVLGDTDRGDDESIPNTVDQSNWIGVGENNGDQLSALGGPIDGGVVYAFKRRAIWTLTPTGINTVPYAAHRLTGSTGANAQDSTQVLITQYTVVTAETHLGHPAVYYVDGTKIYRVSSRAGVELVNADQSEPIDGTTGKVPVCALYWVDRRQLIFGSSTGGVPELHVYNPTLSWLGEDGVIRGGWSQYLIHFAASGSEELRAMTLYPIVSMAFQEPVFAGSTTALAYVGYFTRSGNTGSDMGQAFTASVTSRPYLLGDGLKQFDMEEPILMAAALTGATPTVAYIRDFGAETRTGTSPALTAIGSETRVSPHVEGLVLSDAWAVQAQLTWGSNQFGNAPNTELLDALLMPYAVKADR